MTQPLLTREVGRWIFGDQLSHYLAARPAYPEALYTLLARRNFFADGNRAMEIGAGTGLATRQLLAFPLHHLDLIEPDPRLATALLKSLTPVQRKRVTVLQQPFETTQYPDNAFDVGFCATAFHWLEETNALSRLRQWLKPQGRWAAWWNIFGDSSHPDAFHLASQPLFEEAFGIPSSARPISFGLDRSARIAALSNAGFIAIESEIFRWTLTQNTAQALALTATFSDVARLNTETRRHFLSKLGQLIDTQFGGQIQRTMLTPVYLAISP